MQIPEGVHLPEGVENWLKNGELWRAKQYLDARLRTGVYDRQLHELLGRVLLQMGDRRMAGRHLFCGGVEGPEASGPIETYCSRFRSAEKLYADLPRTLRQAPRRELPPTLRELAVQVEGPESYVRLRVGFATVLRRVGCAVVVAVLFAVIAFVAVATIVGSRIVWRHVMEWMW